MKDFDYNKYYAIGTVDVSYQGNSNGQINVCGYTDGSVFHQLSKQEAKELFPPRGRVFCYNLKRDYHNYQGELVQIEVVPNEKEGDNLDAFVWNFSELNVIGSKIQKIKGQIGSDGDYNYQILEQNGLLNPEEDIYFQSGNKIFHIEAKTTPRLLSYYNLEDFYTITTDTAASYIYDEAGLPVKSGEVDCTNDSQLVEWLFNKVLEGTDLSNLLNGDKETILGAAKVFLLRTKIDPKIIESRMERLSNLLVVYNITLQGLKNIANTPWLKATVDNAIRLYKDDYLTDIINDNKEKLAQIKKEHQEAIAAEQEYFDNEMKKIKDTLEINEKDYEDSLQKMYQRTEDAKKTLNITLSELDEKKLLLKDAEDTYNSIIEKKDDIIKEFSIIKEVLVDCRTPKTESSYTRKYDLEEISYTDTPLPMYRGINRNIENCLQEFYGTAKGANNIGELLLKYNALLVPDLKKLMTIITATGKCAYMTVYVSVAWKSFFDLWDNGLSHIVEKCYEQPEKMHYLVLRNINLTYLPNYLQPIFDMQMGLTSVFPGTQIEFPNNLRLLCTATADDVIPMTKDSLQYIGCLEKTEDLSKKEFRPIQNASEKLKGFLDPILLIKNSDSINNDVENHFEDYING